MNWQELFNLTPFTSVISGAVTIGQDLFKQQIISGVVTQKQVDIIQGMSTPQFIGQYGLPSQSSPFSDLSKTFSGIGIGAVLAIAVGAFLLLKK